MPGKTNASRRSKGKNERQMASLPTPSFHKPAYPFTPNGVCVLFFIFIIFFLSLSLFLFLLLIHYQAF
jgi:hypothetical protein